MKITLAPLLPGHLDYVMTWINDPEVTQYFAGMQKEISRADEAVFLHKLIASPNDKAFSVFLDDVGGVEYVGQVSINQIHWPSGEGRLFLVVRKEFQGRGLAHEIIREIQKLAFGEFKLHRLYLIVRPENAKGIQLYHRCGFRQEGYLYHKYRIGQQWIDMIQLAIIRPWWETWWH